MEEVKNEASVISEQGETAPESNEKEAQAAAADITEYRLENERLRMELFCARRNIPEEMTADVITLARNICEDGDCSFEDAADKVYERLCSYASANGSHKGNTKISDTGVRLHKMIGSDDSALRKAFGLK